MMSWYGVGVSDRLTDLLVVERRDLAVHLEQR